MFAPIVVFGYNRPDHFTKMAASLKANSNFEKHEVFVFIDGPKNAEDQKLINRTAIEAATLTPKVKVSDTNRGLAESVIRGVTEVINAYGCAIVIEDDLILHPRFLDYIDACLEKFKDDKRIISVSGFGLKIKKPENYDGDIYLSRRASSWGWATWADRWNAVDWAVSTFQDLRNSRTMQRAFNRGGSDMYGMLKGYMEGRNNSWAIRFCYHQFRNGLYSVHPFKSLVSNEGFDKNASNCRQAYNRFKTELLSMNEIPILDFNGEIAYNPAIGSELRRYHSIPIRIYSKIRRILNV